MGFVFEEIPMCLLPVDFRYNKICVSFFFASIWIVRTGSQASNRRIDKNIVITRYRLIFIIEDLHVGNQTNHLVRKGFFLDRRLSPKQNWSPRIVTNITGNRKDILAVFSEF